MLGASSAVEFASRYAQLLEKTPDNHTQNREWLAQAASARTGTLEHHRAYVGPPEAYGEMGANQFSLLHLAGFKTSSKLLDVGCGSLRLGRLAMTFLDPTHYHCIELSARALSEGVRHETGHDLLRLKWPSFAINHDFSPPDGIDAVPAYDFMVAQSIFSHVSEALLDTAIKKLRTSMSHSTIFLATFITFDGQPERRKRINARNPAAAYSKQAWVYPGCTTFEESRLAAILKRHGVVGTRLAWPHEAQEWFALCLVRAGGAPSPCTALSERTLHTRWPGRVWGWKISSGTFVTPSASTSRPSLEYEGSTAESVPSGNAQA